MVAGAALSEGPLWCSLSLSLYIYISTYIRRDLCGALVFEYTRRWESKYEQHVAVQTLKKELSQVNMRCLPPTPAQVRSPSPALYAPLAAAPVVVHANVKDNAWEPMSAVASAGLSHH